MATKAPIAPEDLELLERVATRVVELRMDVPAILTLESVTPLSLVAGQAMVFFEPFVAALLPLPHYHRFARLVERRECLAALAGLIETRAEAADADRREAIRARRAARSQTPPRR